MPYRYERQPDSAVINMAQIPVDPGFPTYPVAVVIESVDGRKANFPSMDALQIKALYFSPGTHVLGLYFLTSEDTFRGDRLVGRRSAVSARQTVTVRFMAAHAYEFGAALKQATFQIALWDVSGGTPSAAPVSAWEVAGSRSMRRVLRYSQ